MAVMMKVLGHPARIAIVQELIKRKTCICAEFVETFGLAQATVSQHLKELKNSGLIKSSIEGPSICYCIDNIVWNRYKKEMELFFWLHGEANECC